MFDSYVRAGFNVMNLANNPSTWHGLDPFLRCLEVLDKAGVVYGRGGRHLARARNPVISQRPGPKAPFVARPWVCPPTPAPATEDRGGIAYYPVQTLYEP